MHLGRGYEKRQLYQSVLLKLVVFAGDRGEAVWDGLAQSADGGYGGADIFCAFVPLFAFRELRRLLGEEKLYAVLRGRGVADGPESPAAGQ